MSSNCPPQLQLSIQPNTTSFKRSFEQFGFDLESPVVSEVAGANAAPSDGRNERNKRARSASSFDSETSSDRSSDTIASTSSSGSSAISQSDAAPTSFEPPRLATPEIQDVEMPDYPEPEPIDVEREGQRGSEQYRLSLERFNQFDNEIAVLRQSSTASPPTLPPLRHRTAFFEHDESTSSPFTSAFFDNAHPTTNSTDSPQGDSAAPSDPHFDLFRASQPLSIPSTDRLPLPGTGFRDRLDTALERLRSPSPLVPGLEDELGPRVAEDEDQPMGEEEAESETEESDERRSIVHDPPPTLPPIESIEDFLPTRITTPAPTAHTVPQEPPTLPPIPVIAEESVVDAAERPWRGRSHFFTERFDAYMGLNSAPEHVDRSPSQSPSDIQEPETSPRPFSRSARSASSSSRNPSALPNPTLVDHPLPSPILRDLHSWIEERQPLLSNDAYHRHIFEQADDGGSVSGISTTAATAGTEREASSMASSTSQAGSSTSSETSTSSQQDRLSRMIDRIRTNSRSDEWIGHGVRRPWLSPAASRTPPVEPDTRAIRDQPPWYTDDTSPASLFSSIPSAAPAASRPISTTPAPGNSLFNHNENSAMGSFWEPVFTNLPEATLSNVQPASTLTRAQADTPSRYYPDDAGFVADGGTTINPTNAANSGDSRASDHVEGIWRPLESSDLPLGLSFNSALDSPTLNQNSSQNSRPPSSALNNSVNTYRSSNRLVSRQRNLLDPGTRHSLTLDSFNARDNPFPPAVSVERQAREDARHTREMESYMFLPRRNWQDRFSMESRPQNTYNHSRMPPSATNMDTVPPTSTQSSEISSSVEARPAPHLRHRPLRTYSSQTRLGSSNSLVTENASEVRRRADRAEVRRLPADRYSSSFFGSDAETHSVDDIDEVSIFRQPRGGPSWESALSSRNYVEFRRRPSITPEARPEARPETRLPRSGLVASSISDFDFARSSAFPSLTTFVDGLDPRSRNSPVVNADERRMSQPTVDVSGRTGLSDSQIDYWEFAVNPEIPDFSGSLSANPHPDAPSLPPPDLGTSFDAEQHDRSLQPRSWAAEDIVLDMAEQPVTSAPPDSPRLSNMEEVVDNRLQRSTARFSFPSSVISPADRQITDREQQNERSIFSQTASEERLQRFQFDRMLQAVAPNTRVRFSAPTGSIHTTSRPPTLPTSPNVRGPTSPASASTIGTSMTSSPAPTRPSLNEPRRTSAGDPSGGYSLFDPSTFAAGPFRNTLQHFVDEREGSLATRLEPSNQASAPRSILRRPPPYIPPLSFDDENEHLFSSPRPVDNSGEPPRYRGMPNARQRNEASGAENRMAPRIQRELPFETSPSRMAPEADYEAYPFPTFRPTSSIANEVNDTSDSNPLRRYGNPTRSNAIHMHRYISQQARMEATRAEELRHSLYPPREAGQIQPDSSAGPSHALRSALLMQRFHREREPVIRTEEDEEAVPGETVNGQRARTHRRRMLRAHQEAAMTFSNISMGPNWRRGRVLGDFMRDEDFDDSYENLLSLSMQIGDAKPRATPSEILEKMEKGVYKEWATEASDTRCPICLDDYAPTDRVQKLSNCPHWLHQECLTQWLQSASTCPVCRESVNPPSPGPSLFASLGLPRYLHGPRRRRDSSPSAPAPPSNSDMSRRANPPSSPSAQDPINNSRDGHNRNTSQGSNGSRESPTRNYFGQPRRRRFS